MSTVTIAPGGTRVGVVDADPMRREALSALLRDAGYVTGDRSDGPGDRHRPDLVLVDLDDVPASAVSALVATERPPVIGITGDSSATGRRRAVDAGVADFIVRPIETAELRMRIDNTLRATRLRHLLSDRSARLTEALRDQSIEAGSLRESLSILAAVADFHDDDTDQHAQRVGRMSGDIARALGLPEDFVVMLLDAAPLHDIGKVGLSRRILLKPGSLTPSERVHMMQHVDIGGQILAGAQSPVLRLAAEIARTHHERWDGSGYTDGLSGEQIPVAGRIVAVADVWDTLTHDRPYRAAWTLERALAEIHDQSGAHFDPAVVEAFSSLEPGVVSPAARDVRVA